MNKNVLNQMEQYYRSVVLAKHGDTATSLAKKSEDVALRHSIQVNTLANELAAYQPMLDIPYERFHQVAEAVISLGYSKIEALVDVLVDAIVFSGVENKTPFGDTTVTIPIHELAKIAGQFKYE